MSTTPAPSPAASSAGVNSRPRAGRTPRAAHQPAVTAPTAIRSRLAAADEGREERIERGGGAKRRPTPCIASSDAPLPSTQRIAPSGGAAVLLDADEADRRRQTAAGAGTRRWRPGTRRYWRRGPRPRSPTTPAVNVGRAPQAAGGIPGVMPGLGAERARAAAAVARLGEGHQLIFERARHARGPARARPHLGVKRQLLAHVGAGRPVVRTARVGARHDRAPASSRLTAAANEVHSRVRARSAPRPLGVST